jgi:hypothetical protein
MDSKEIGGIIMSWLQTILIVGGGILAGALIASILFGGDCPVIITFIFIGISMYIIYRLVESNRTKHNK